MLQLYNALLPLARLAARILARRHPKLREGLEGRRGAEQRLLQLGKRGQWIWVHTTSVGEYEQARPITSILRDRRPDLEILHTFFSPSGFNYARRLGEAPVIEYLPEDTPGQIGRVLEALQPRALVIVKFDLWPNLIVEAHKRNIPILLVDATLQPHSYRSRWPARSLYRELYARLNVISAVSAKDAARFRQLVPFHPRIVVDGDTRFDQVVRRRRHADQKQLPATLLERPRPFTFIAGSTWGPDEERIVPAWATFLQSGGEPSFDDSRRARMILVPHEPTPAHLQPLQARLEAAGLSWRLFSRLAAEPLESLDVVLVDQVGILAELYALADVAYVGGAFTTGVHNVMEPAISGLPLLFGPRHLNAPEAEMLLEAGAARVIASAADLERELRTLAAQPATRSAIGGRARAFVESNLGASERCVQRLIECLESPTPRTEEHV